jgi:hypothetical protein
VAAAKPPPAPAKAKKQAPPTDSQAAPAGSPAAAEEPRKEKRRDPYNGKILTFDELAAFYKGKYSQAEIVQYWNMECKTQQSQRKSQNSMGKNKNR